MSIDWVFPSSNGGSYDGFNDAGIETFSGARYDGLAREIIQNSLDAAVDDQTKVTVEFDFCKIKRKEFPGADGLLEAMRRCRQESNRQESKNAKSDAFLRQSMDELKKQEIPCLKISDTGTTGLRGDYRQRAGQWYAITKARGVSDKNDPGAGGSYGIGKSAPFTVSSLRTVFYSTLYKDGNDSVCRAQGKSILMSHSTDDGGYTQATGFYGETEGCMPIEDNIPDILRPEKQGCVVFIPGFVAESKWKQKIMITVASNFFCAIDQKKLEVLIQDERGDIEIIDHDSLDDCLQKLSDLKSGLDKVENSHGYYQTMKSVRLKESELPLLGHCKMWVKVGEGLPKRVALLRKTGMLITDDQAGIKRWSGRRDFTGVFMCESSKGNELLREMENPQHNAFEPERAISERRNECKKALDELIKWVRACVDELAKPEMGEVAEIDELAEFFPDPNPSDAIPGDEGERNIEGRPIYSPKPLKRPKAKDSTWEDENGDEGGASENGGGNGDGTGDGSGEGAGDGGSGSRSSMKAVEIRNVRIVSDMSNDKIKTVYFTPAESGDIKVSLFIMGDDGSTERIDAVDVGGQGKNVAEVVAQQGNRVSLEATLDHPMDNSIMVKAFREKSEKSGNETSTE